MEGKNSKVYQLIESIEKRDILREKLRIMYPEIYAKEKMTCYIQSLEEVAYNSGIDLEQLKVEANEKAFRNLLP